jgi:5-(carboxyamino)imidazole ribonucleotide synthase
MDKQKTSAQFKVGILGGGQLGRMIIQEAVNYDFHIHIMDSDPNAPCSRIAYEYTIGDIRNYNHVLRFGQDKDVLTVEIENVNIEALYELERKGVTVYPQPRVLELIKDKGTQKEFYAANNIPTAPFELLTADPDKNTLKAKIPFVNKLRTGGYDGKGVQIIRSEEDLPNVFKEAGIAEELIPFEKELSVIVARNKSGEMACFPVVECEFNDANLVEYLFSPADITREIENEAIALAQDVISKIDMVGLLAVELFLTKDGQLLVNEIAPRPHNSGHHTIECNVTSQFEQHLRSILDLPLGSTRAVQAGAMLNVIGSEGYIGPAVYEGLNHVLETEGAHLHLYGKEQTKPFRKMGHLTITGENMPTVRGKVDLLRGKLIVKS